MDPGLFEAVVGAIGVLWGVVWAGQKTGKIPTVDANPKLTKAIEDLKAITESASKAAETTHEILVEILEVGKTNRAELQILRSQHGEPAKQGQYEEWKYTPEDRRCLSGSFAYSSASAFMAEIALRMKVAEVEGRDPKEYLASARAAIERHDKVRGNYS